MKLIFATGNSGKLREAREILGPSGIEVVSPYDLGLSKKQVDIEETGKSFSENAVLKAENIWRLTGLPCFADDSGLAVDALEGAPGIYSARYASLDGSGEDHNFASNIDKLLHNLGNNADRRARFVCSVALILPEEGNRAAEHFPRSSAPLPSAGVIKQFDGTCEGSIAMERAGCGGFGYDPVFIADAYPDRTLAEVAEDAKNAISHRGDALRKMLGYLDSIA